MKVLSIEDQPDGSAIIEVEITEHERNTILEYGFIQLIKKGMEDHEDNFRTPIPE